MVHDTLAANFRAEGGRVRALLAMRLRDLDLAEEAFAEACLRAAQTWPESGVPADPAAWLWRVAARCAVDLLRMRGRAQKLSHALEVVADTKAAEDAADAGLIPDERLRLIFVCCHPAVAADSRAALTLRLVCGLELADIARAFLVTEAALAQRLVRAKRKIAQAGVGFEIPGPAAWPERLDAVLSTLEVAFSRAYADAAGCGAYAGFAEEMLMLSGMLARLLPQEPEAQGLAASLCLAEARRPARVAADGAMIPLARQDPALWRDDLLQAGGAYLGRAVALGGAGPRVLQAAIHQAWCNRKSVADPPPWADILALYDRLLACRNDPVTRLNRLVPLAELRGVTTALAELEALAPVMPAQFQPYHAVRADFLRRAGRVEEARTAYDQALALRPGAAEQVWLRARRDG